MKTITDLIPAASRQLATAQPVKAQELAPEVKRETERLINDLFGQLRSIYPAWKQAWTSEDLYRKAKATWTQALLDAGIADWSLIERGLSRCRQEPGDFIPSVGKFIDRCWPTPVELGAPDHETAYWEAQRNSHPAIAGRGRWSHRAVFHAALLCGRHSLMTLPSDVGRLKMAKAYGEVIQRLARGEDLPEPAPALSADVHRKGDPAKASAALAAMRAAVGGARA
ncbi:phage replication protein P [Halopseudomonas litoralis]|uniref:Phage replication protein P n=1 Tax=Halopseudomonas litoralis TaxID=797277 RepID=A0A1H1QPU4_9GAMM|nr:replication protein P [Halopseudomonas litoralis]SDS25468.1 phage replication protein P [Halopseudomonas litoralis]